MNEQFDDLAKAIFDHDHRHPDCPTADWDQQADETKNRFRVAAMTARIITMGPIYDIRMPQPAEPA